MRYGRVLFGVVLALVVIGVLAGVGLTAYNAGVIQGAVANGKFVAPTEGNTLPIVPQYGFYQPFGFYRPFGFGFGFLRCLVPLFFILLLLMLFRFAFRPRWGGHWMRPGWDPSRGDFPPAVKEWHRKLHEEEANVPPAPAQ